MQHTPKDLKCQQKWWTSPLQRGCKHTLVHTYYSLVINVKLLKNVYVTILQKSVSFREKRCNSCRTALNVQILWLHYLFRRCSSASLAAISWPEDTFLITIEMLLQVLVAGFVILVTGILCKIGHFLYKR